jgi:hypothetical protein
VTADGDARLVLPLSGPTPDVIRTRTDDDQGG